MQNLLQDTSITPQGIVIAGRRLPVTRGQLMLLMVAINEMFLGLDIYLAHVLNGNIRPGEWIPIIFGPLAGVALLLAGVIALRRRRLAVLLAFAVFAVSIVIGLLGAFFHVDRALPPSGLGEQAGAAVALFVFAPPIIGPLTFSLIGVLGVIAAVYEDPPGSGRMVVPGLFSWRVPFNKTQQYCLWIGLGILATLLSSVLDHGRFNFENLWVWLPTAVGIFATIAAITYGLIDQPGRGDTITYVAAMLGMILVGVVGLLLHVETDLARSGIVVVERFLRGAPFLAPMLFADMGALGLIAILPVVDRLEEEQPDTTA